MTLREIIEQDLRGHEYVAARGLSPATAGKPAQNCHECLHKARLEHVQRILAARSEASTSNTRSTK
ncbi:MAG TPA: hypothetical protein VIT92_11955 [Burkholderiaceae bacterium]